MARPLPPQTPKLWAWSRRAPTQDQLTDVQHLGTWSGEVTFWGDARNSTPVLRPVFSVWCLLRGPTSSRVVNNRNDPFLPGGGGRIPQLTRTEAFTREYLKKKKILLIY